MVMNICEVCGEEFETSRPAKYCSEDCKKEANMKARNARRRASRKVSKVCPICGNVIHCSGETVVSCCGVTLPALDAEEPDEEHTIQIEDVEDEQFIVIEHSMTKEHYISFIAFVTTDRLQLVKLYPEGNAQTRLQLRGCGFLYFYCNRHGLYRQRM